MREISYNGHKFSQYAQFTCSIEAVYDAARQSVIAHRLSINVRDFVFLCDYPAAPTIVPPPTDTGLQMENIRVILMQSKKELIIRETGFPEIVLTPGTPQRHDIDYGPYPRSLNWFPVGDNQVAEISWTCDATIVPCAFFDLSPGDADNLRKHLASANFDQSFSFNERGYFTETHNYIYEFTTQQDSIKNRWLQLFINYSAFLKDNCTHSNSVRWSSDNKRLEVTVTFKEIESPSAYPAGVISISSPTTASFRMPRKDTKTMANITIAARIELNALVPRVRAWEIWNTIVSRRLLGFTDNGEQYIVRDFTATEDIYSNTFSFSISLSSPNQTVNRNLSLLRFFVVADKNWQLWRDSRIDINRVNGVGNITFSGSSIKDGNPCADYDPQGSLTRTRPFPADNPSKTIAQLLNPTPTPTGSWVDVDVELIEAPEISRLAYTTYGDVNIGQSSFSNGGGSGSGTPSVPPAITIQPGGEDGYQVQLVDAPPIQRYIWRGQATRIGFPIPTPTRVEINGKQAKVIGTPYISNALVGYSFGLPVYEASWNIGLVLVETSSPTAIEYTDPTGFVGRQV